MKARAQSAGATGAGNEAKDRKKRPSQAAVSLRHRTLHLEALRGPARRCPH